MRTITMILGLAVIFIVSARGQGYVNLNFESAQNLPGNPPIPNGTDVAATNALPGWTAYNGEDTLLSINYVSNYISGAATSVELEGGSLAISGDFSVGLYGDGSISQTGLVPDNAESLSFAAHVPGGNGLGASGLSVNLGGQALLFSAISENANYTVFGANIPSDLDGQMEALTFFIEGGTGDVLVDDVEFSTPEPSEWAMIGLGVVLFGLRRQSKRGITAKRQRT